MQLGHRVICMNGVYLPHLLLIEFKWLIALKASFHSAIIHYCQNSIKGTPVTPLLWERDLGSLTGDQWEEVYQAVATCSLNVAQKLSQLYILLRSHYTPLRLYKMGYNHCHRCKRDHGDLILLLWRWLRLHLYWKQVVDMLNTVFKVTILLDPKCCILNILEGVVEEEHLRLALGRALFHALRLILLMWKSPDPPTQKSWVSSIGNSLLLESYIYTRRGCPGIAGKFEKGYGMWLDIPGLQAPGNLFIGEYLIVRIDPKGLFCA